jgi:hypothetical protein
MLAHWRRPALLALVLAALLLLPACGKAPAEEEGAVAEIVDHPFWKEEVTPEDVQAWVALIRELRPDTLFTLDASAQQQLYTGAEADARRRLAWDRARGRLILIDMKKYKKKKPNRIQVLRDLKDELDRAEADSDTSPFEKSGEE